MSDSSKPNPFVLVFGAAGVLIWAVLMNTHSEPGGSNEGVEAMLGIKPNEADPGKGNNSLPALDAKTKDKLGAEFREKLESALREKREAARREAEKEKPKLATIAYWNAFWRIGLQQHRNLGTSPSRKQVGRSYSNGAEQMMTLPILNVDQELVSVVQKFAAKFLELSELSDRAEEMESFNYNFGRLAESFARGLQGDFRGGIGVGIDENKRIENENAKAAKVREDLRSCFQRLNQIRARLTATYGVEFEMPK